MGVYVQSIVWDKGVAHIAGNVNSNTIRQFPVVVTEVCVFYRRSEDPQTRLCELARDMRTKRTPHLLVVLLSMVMGKRP